MKMGSIFTFILKIRRNIIFYEVFNKRQLILVQIQMMKGSYSKQIYLKARQKMGHNSSKPNISNQTIETGISNREINGRQNQNQNRIDGETIQNLLNKLSGQKRESCCQAINQILKQIPTLEILETSNKQKERLQSLKKIRQDLINNQKINSILKFVQQRLKAIAKNQQISFRGSKKQQNYQSAKFYIETINLIKKDSIISNLLPSSQTEQLKNYKIFLLLDYQKKCFNINTFFIMIKTLYAEKLMQLYQVREKARQQIDAEVSQEHQKKALSQKIPRRVREQKLKNLVWQIDQRIKDLEEEQAYNIPFKFEQSIDDTQGNILRNINFFCIVAWIISFYLAYKDNSQCLDDTIPGGDSTFRKWILANAWITLAASISVITYCLLYQKKIKDKIISVIKNSSCCLPNVWSTMFSVGQVFITVSVLLSVLAKIVCILFGIIFFLAYVDFGRCSDNVLNYCSIQFVAFFTFFMHFLVTSVIKCVKQRNQSLILSINNQLFDDKDYIISNQQIEIMQKQEKQKKIKLYANNDDLSDIMEKLLLWSFVGWVYDLVLWKKDKSPCLDENYLNNQLTYRQWLVVDGWYSLGLTFGVLILLLKKAISKHEMVVWKQQNGMYHLQTNFSDCQKFYAYTLLICGIGKFAWIILGIVMLFVNLDANTETRSTEIKCSSNVSNFLIAYFTEMIYITAQGGKMLIQGYILNGVLKKQHKEHIRKRNEDITNQNPQQLQIPAQRRSGMALQ